MKIYNTLGIFFIVVSLSACTAESNSPTSASSESISILSSSVSSATNIDLSNLWRRYESSNLGLSLFYPAIYNNIKPETESTIEFNNTKILGTEILFSEDQNGESASIRIIKTNDPQILKYLATTTPLKNRTISNTQVQYFQFEGMGSMSGFVYKVKDGYIIVSFTFPPSEKIMESVFESIRIY